MSYEDGSEGPPGSFENYKAEGEVLFKQHEYKKALESFNTALDIRQGDKNCLVARSQCYLQLGDADKALADADETLSDDKDNIKGLLQKAEAYYQIGQFESALMFYHRGHKLRPEKQEFRLGIQKSQEAIVNSIGDGAGIELENKGDLTYFYEEQQKQNQKGKQKGKGTYGRPGGKKDDKKDQRRCRSTQDKKTVKQLLGELYSDKEYLEKLLEETENGSKSETNETVKDLAENCLKYLDSRTQFWQQQKPMYSRKHEQEEKKRARQSKSNKQEKEPTEYILAKLEEIDAAQADGKYEQSLKQAKKVLREVEKWSDEDVSNRPDVVANLHSCIGNSYLEMGDYSKSLEHHQKDYEIAEQKDLDDAKSRALDNLGRVHARMGEFKKAVKVWEEKLPMSKSALESTWLYHEIGRCYLEMGEYDNALDYGEKSLQAAEEAEDDVWQLNASVLIAQSQVKQAEHSKALDTFEKAFNMAKVQGDKAAESAIKKAIEDVNQKIVKSIKEEEEEKKSAKGEDSQEGSPKGSPKGSRKDSPKSSPRGEAKGSDKQSDDEGTKDKDDDEKDKDKGDDSDHERGQSEEQKQDDKDSDHEGKR